MRKLSVVLCLLLIFSEINGIVFRIRQSNGLVTKYSAEPSDKVSILRSYLADCSAADSIALNNGEKHTLESLCQSGKTISECNIVHGDLLTVIPSFKPASNRTKSTRNVTSKPVVRPRSPLKSGSIRRFLKDKASKVKIKRQLPTTRLTRFAPTTMTVFERSCQTDSLLLLLGKTSIIDTTDKLSKNVHTLQRRSSQRKIDNVVAVVELTNAISEQLSPAFRRRIESAAALAKSLNLTVLGCAFGNVNLTEGWNSRHIRVSIQAISALGSLNDTATLEDFLIVSARNASSEAVSSQRSRQKHSKQKLPDSKVVLEVFQFTDQAVKLYSDGVLTSEPPLMRNNYSINSQVQFNGSVFIEQKEVSSVDATVLLVPVAVELLTVNHSNNSKRNIAKLPIFHHHFPSFDQLANVQTQKTAEEYFLRLLKQILKSSASGVSVAEAADRLIDPHLLMFIQATLGPSFCDSLCGYLMTVGEVLPAALAVQLEQLMKVLVLRVSALNNKDE